jgi:hypothetical protein
MLKEKFYTTTWFVILMLIVFIPIGLILMWKYSKFNIVLRILITCIFSVVVLSSVSSKDTKAVMPTPNKLTEKTVETILKDNLGSLAVVKVTSDEVFITPTDEYFVFSILAAISGDEENIKAWHSLIESFKSLSLNLKGYNVYLLNPANESNTILYLRNGHVLYNVVK